MSKDYWCRDCRFNRNGWCDQRKMQGLKQVTACEYKQTSAEPVIEAVVDSESEFEKHRVLGKRELLAFLSQQVVGMELQGMESISIAELKQLFLSFDQSVQIDEAVFGIAVRYEMDQALIEGNRKLMNHWKKELEQK